MTWSEAVGYWRRLRKMHQNCRWFIRAFWWYLIAKQYYENFSDVGKAGRKANYYRSQYKKYRGYLKKYSTQIDDSLLDIEAWTDLIKREAPEFPEDPIIFKRF